MFSYWGHAIFVLAPSRDTSQPHIQIAMSQHHSPSTWVREFTIQVPTPFLTPGSHSIASRLGIHREARVRLRGVRHERLYKTSLMLLRSSSPAKLQIWFASTPTVQPPVCLSATTVGPAPHFPPSRKGCVALEKRNTGPAPQMIPWLRICVRGVCMAPAN